MTACPTTGTRSTPAGSCRRAHSSCCAQLGVCTDTSAATKSGRRPTRCRAASPATQESARTYGPAASLRRHRQPTPRRAASAQEQPGVTGLVRRERGASRRRTDNGAAAPIEKLLDDLCVLGHGEAEARRRGAEGEARSLNEQPAAGSESRQGVTGGAASGTDHARKYQTVLPCDGTSKRSTRKPLEASSAFDWAWCSSVLGGSGDRTTVGSGAGAASARSTTCRRRERKLNASGGEFRQCWKSQPLGLTSLCGGEELRRSVSSRCSHLNPQPCSSGQQDDARRPPAAA